MPESQLKPAAESRYKRKVQNVRSDAGRVVDGENERPAPRPFASFLVCSFCLRNEGFLSSWRCSCVYGYV